MIVERIFQIAFMCLCIHIIQQLLWAIGLSHFVLFSVFLSEITGSIDCFKSRSDHEEIWSLTGQVRSPAWSRQEIPDRPVALLPLHSLATTVGKPKMAGEAEDTMLTGWGSRQGRHQLQSAFSETQERIWRERLDAHNLRRLEMIRMETACWIEETTGPEATSRHSLHVTASLDCTHGVFVLDPSPQYL